MRFVQGRNAFHSYLGSGRSDDLLRAHESLEEAHRTDPAFALASFYLAMAANELRGSETAISLLEQLVQRPIAFLPEALLQLAYAHTKTYRSESFLMAERILDKASEQAAKRSQRDLVAIIQAYRVFLFAVMGGRFEDRSKRVGYIDQALHLGNRLLSDVANSKSPAGDQIRFEVHNALGIAYWRKGMHEEPFSPAQNDQWERARHHFQSALGLRPGATRVLQNQGSLLLSEGDQLLRAGRESEARDCYLASQAVYQASLALNPLDQFPHYRMSQLAARLGDWSQAETYLRSGRVQPGSIGKIDWTKLVEAIQYQDVSRLLTHEE